ncbi:hypothetical protein HKD37_18G050465 [Glycine soja]
MNTWQRNGMEDGYCLSGLRLRLPNIYPYPFSISDKLTFVTPFPHPLDIQYPVPALSSVQICKFFFCKKIILKI